MEPMIAVDYQQNCELPESQRRRAVDLLRRHGCGGPVGYRSITKTPNWDSPCPSLCIPGGTRHVHAAVAGFLLVGTRGSVEVDLGMEVKHVSPFRPLTGGQP